MKSETKLFVAIILGTIAIVVAGIFLMTRGTTSATKVDSSLLVRADSDRIASGSGTITMVEFGDFQCPACGAYYPVVKQVVSDFHTQINYVFRNFPLDSIHPNAHIAAQAAEAAGVQGKYWEMHDMLYVKQAEWSDKSNARDIFAGYAQSLGLDVNKFKTDIDSSVVTSKVQEDISDGNALTINQTPTFFINGQMIDNPATFADFETLIKSAIDKAPKPTVTKEAAYHVHANFKVYLNGAAFDFSPDKYQSLNGKDIDEFIHLHDNKGDLIHIHKQGITLGEVFKSLGMTLTSTSFTDDNNHVYRNSEQYGLFMFVNGKPNTQFDKYVPQDLDRIAIIYGAETDPNMQKEIDSVADDACIYSLKCPERGKPPTEDCVGGLGTGCTE